MRRDNGDATTSPSTIPTPTIATSTPNPVGPAFTMSAKNSPVVMTTPAPAAATMTPPMSARITGWVLTKTRPSRNCALKLCGAVRVGIAAERIVMLAMRAALTRNESALNQIGSATGRSAKKLPAGASRSARAMSTA